MAKATVPVTAPFPPDLEKRARFAAIKQGISRAEFVRLAVKDFLSRLRDLELTPEVNDDEPHQ